MGLLVADCPRCAANQMTFDVLAQVYRFTKYEWQNWFEIFCRCRACARSTIFLVGIKQPMAGSPLTQKNGLVDVVDGLNDFLEIERFISVRDNSSISPPEHVPEEIKNVFAEGATCLTVGCFNAAAVMFRLCVDLATKPLLPLPDPSDANRAQPNAKQRRDLGLRLPWLFDNGLLPIELKELASCIKEDGNDGAHVGNLSKVDADDLLDFTIALLERLITEPEKLKIAQQRRDARRPPKT